MSVTIVVGTAEVQVVAAGHQDAVGTAIMVVIMVMYLIVPPREDMKFFWCITSACLLSTLLLQRVAALPQSSPLTSPRPVQPAVPIQVSVSCFVLP